MYYLTCKWLYIWTSSVEDRASGALRDEWLADSLRTQHLVESLSLVE